MKIHHEPLSDVVRYIEAEKDTRLEQKKPTFRSIMAVVSRFHDVNRQTKILEVGSGIGWFPILCKKEGLSCKGLEISPQLVEHARRLGRQYGVEPDIELANIEEVDLGVEQYDVVVACSSFEHVEDWRLGLTKVFHALKPGGVLYFYSSNRFNLRSGEFNFPLYSWLPNTWRYRLRVACQGEQIMKLGIDFNQFTATQLRRFFTQLGFSRVMDLIDVYGPQHLSRATFHRKAALRLLKTCAPLKHGYLLFARGTFFICVK